jgi:hypothetical protein
MMLILAYEIIMETPQHLYLHSFFQFFPYCEIQHHHQPTLKKRKRSHSTHQNTSQPQQYYAPLLADFAHSGHGQPLGRGCVVVAAAVAAAADVATATPQQS